jgi:hypothetical protein
MTRIGKIAYEYGLSKDQASTFESFAAEKFAGHIWLNSYEPGISPKPKEWYEQMASKHLYAARVLEDLASTLWNIDLEAIYRELAQEERREIYRGF